MRESEGKSAGRSVQLTAAPVNAELPRFVLFEACHDVTFAEGLGHGVIPLPASSAKRAQKGPVVVAAARPAVVVVSDTAAASAWLPSAGSENPTMTWRVTPSPASIARRGAGAKPVPPWNRFPLPRRLPRVASPWAARVAGARTPRANDHDPAADRR